MEPQDKQLQEILEISRENNQLLKGVHRRARWSMFFWIARWVIVVGILFGAYYYVEPYVQKVTDTYHKTSDTFKQFQSTADKVQAMFGTETSTQATSTEPSVLDTLLKFLGQ